MEFEAGENLVGVIPREVGKGTVLSYKQTLSEQNGEQENYYSRYSSQWDGNGVEDSDLEEIREDEEEDDQLCPVVYVSSSEKRSLRKPWRTTLIIKLMGRSIRYRFLLNRLVRLWKIKGDLQLIDVDHYLIVQQWRRDFDNMEQLPSRLAVWIKILGMPIEYFDEDFLWEVGDKLRNTIKVDDATLKASRGNFARLCVEVDLNKPLIPKIKVGKRIHEIMYKGPTLGMFLLWML
ncbi:reverse transcriptase [Quillaja saponaria]|uniref:Reverse transcriptase n=1 Tax=Quillaja saponaria TaxID=32244 RepID=A0AAD7LPZ6_QUISA|nr:reverse transcriptase [Quillaja saponaria]